MRALQLVRSGFVALSPLVLACGGAETTPQVPAMPVPAASPLASPTEAASSPAPGSEALAAAPAPEPPAPKAPVAALTIKDVGFATPESVLHDEEADVYLVSNVNGAPTATDGNGFISRVSPEGKILQLKWIEGGKNDVKLDAPKGLAILGPTLYVADISVVRTFDRKTGKPTGDVKLPGATFVNDVAARAGKVYASDSGIKFSDKGVESTKTEAVWVIEKNKAKSVATGDALGKPNGLLATDKGLWVVTFGSGELYRLDDKGQKQDAQKLPKGALDGIVPVGDALLVSSWDASTVYRGKAGGAFEPFLTDLKAPADIGYDAKRGRVLVPLFNDHAVVIFDAK